MGVISHVFEVQTYGAQEGPYQERAKEIYAELRQNIIKNVHKVCAIWIDDDILNAIRDGLLILMSWYLFVFCRVVRLGIRTDGVCLGTI